VPEHDSLPDTAVIRLEVTATLTRVKLRRPESGPVPVAQGGGGSAYSVMPYVDCTRIALAGPATVSPLLKVADHVPVSEFCDCSVSDSRAVPSPKMGSLIEPDQLPAGDTTVDAALGDAGADPPPQPARLTTAAATKANR
jgi:hypothetical protein